MFDTHCHLNSLYQSSQDFIHSCLPTDSHYLAVTASADEWCATIDFCSRYKQVLPSLGIHPWFVQNHNEHDLELMKSLIKPFSIKAIGEIGLDFLPQYRAHAEQQLLFFEKQLLIAEHYDLPVSLHIVKAHNEALELLNGISVRGAVHGLGSSVQVAQQYIDLGLKIGINGVACRDNASRYHKLVRYAGLQNILLETDYPNIILPQHTQPNLADIHQVAIQVASLLDISVEKVLQATNNNARTLFHV